MTRRLAAASAVAVLMMLLLAPAASAQENSYTGTLPSDQVPAIADPEPARAEVGTPADVGRTETLAATGVDAGVALTATVLLLGAGTVILLATRRRERTATA